MSVAPKDRSFGATSSLKDRLSWVVVQDSVGYKKGTERLFKKIGITTVGIVLDEHNRRRGDRKIAMNSINSKLGSTKRKRAAKMLKKIKDSYKADEKAEKEGMSYGSGIAFAGNSSPTEEEGAITALSIAAEQEEALEIPLLKLQ